jgi:hypothetical protein
MSQWMCLRLMGVPITVALPFLLTLTLCWWNDQNFCISRIAVWCQWHCSSRFVRQFHSVSFIHSFGSNTIPHWNKPNYNKLYKLRTLLSDLKRLFKRHSVPSDLLQFMKALWLSKAEAQWSSQYLPLKTVRCGFGVFVICCLGTGYMLNFLVYEGKSTDSQEDGPLRERIVLFASLFEFLKQSFLFCTLELLWKHLSHGLFMVMEHICRQGSPSQKDC